MGEESSYKRLLEDALVDFAETSDAQIAKFPPFAGPITERFFHLDEMANQIQYLMEKGVISKSYADIYRDGYEKICQVYKGQLESLEYSFDIEAEALRTNPACETIRALAKQTLTLLKATV